MEKSAEAFRTISEVAEDLDLPQHVLRFWETRFAQIKPLKRGGGRRYYRPEDVDLLRAIRHLLYGEGYTIKGVQRILKEHGPRAVAQMALTQMRPDAPPAPAPAPAPKTPPPKSVAPAAKPEPPPVLARPAPDATPQPGPAPVARLAQTLPAPLAPRAVETPRQEAFDLDAPSSTPPLRFAPVIDPPGPPRLDIAPAPARAPASLIDAARDALRAHPPEAPRAPEPPRAPESVVPVVDPPRARFLAPVEPRFAPAPALGAQEIERLKAALYELSECERILAAARGG